MSAPQHNGHEIDLMDFREPVVPLRRQRAERNDPGLTEAVILSRLQARDEERAVDRGLLGPDYRVCPDDQLPSHNRTGCLTCRRNAILVTEALQQEQELRKRAQLQRVADGKATSEEEAEALARFTTYTPAEVAARERKQDIVEGLLGSTGTLNEIDGYRGSMKSLLTLSLAATVGGGHDKLLGTIPVNIHGSVLYVYLEGVDGLTGRVNAWQHYHNQPMQGVTFTHVPIDMKRPDDVRSLAILARHHGSILIILDSVAKTGGGKEDAEDFGRYRLGLETLRDATGSAVLVLHNSGHDQSRGRGHTTLIDSMDSAVLLRPRPRGEGGGVKLVDEKSRDSDGIEGLVIKFEPCGPLNPNNGKPWSGVPVVMDAFESAANIYEVHGPVIDKLLDAIDNAATPGEATKQEVMTALGLTSGNNFTRDVAEYVKNGIIRHNDRTGTARRWLRAAKAPR